MPSVECKGNDLLNAMKTIGIVVAGYYTALPKFGGGKYASAVSEAFNLIFPSSEKCFILNNYMTELKVQQMIDDAELERLKRIWKGIMDEYNERGAWLDKNSFEYFNYMVEFYFDLTGKKPQFEIMQHSTIGLFIHFANLRIALANFLANQCTQVITTSSGDVRNFTKKEECRKDLRAPDFDWESLTKKEARWAIDTAIKLMEEVPKKKIKDSDDDWQRGARRNLIKVRVHLQWVT